MTDIYGGKKNNGDKLKAFGEENELLKFMRSLNTVFDSVRLIDEAGCREVKESKGGLNGSIEQSADYDFALAAFEKKGRISKIRFEESKIYFMIDKYIEGEKGGFVLELVSCIDKDFLMELYGGGEKIAEKIIKYNKAAVTDALTGAYNRRYFEEYAKAMSGIEGVVMFDLDKFKSINDKYGHETGDEALKAFSLTVSGSIRDTDIFIRLGGDEFLLLFPKIRRDSFENKLNTILRAVEGTAVNGFPDIRLSASIGGVYGMFPVSKAVKPADKLMFEAKRIGGGRVLCYFEESEY